MTSVPGTKWRIKTYIYTSILFIVLCCSAFAIVKGKSPILPLIIGAVTTVVCIFGSDQSDYVWCSFEYTRWKRLFLEISLVIVLISVSIGLIAKFVF